MDSAGGRISVWVRAEEKLVLGLSKRTTCADVVKALLEDVDKPEHQRYCIAEKWRGLQRVLPDRTRIWRLWVAWGEERDRVRFVLVGCSEVARSAEARLVPLGKSDLVPSKWTPGASLAEVPLERQRRIVRKAFRKLEKMQRKQPTSSCADKMQTLARLVVSQDRTIRQQAFRIRQLDAEIERREAKVHSDRARTHGVNYVQDTYLLEEEADTEASNQVCSSEGLLHPCALCHEANVDMMTMQMEAELDECCTQMRSEEEEDEPSWSFIKGEDEMFVKEKLRSLLDATLYVGLCLRSDLEAIRGDLELSRQICSSREEEMRDLLEKINSLGSEDGANDEGGTDNVEMRRSALERKSEWVEQARGYSKCHRGNDDDSDTGLSSLHSQESDSLTICQSLV
ncbi:ras association domain-containing protein 10 [Corythoichthys intestinalis]|uniref:ras association domain-containing protein 10 n=1 Tax=Corythoichthys intestinalis TaxID=161448 RepID=UPI0025A56B57|nr:ras association domain-containing protein 10 [Corythoichthys intestinalis]XP_061796152.1 ras association domain-containing protein 10-like [Nerophis lumbriciformis]